MKKIFGLSIPTRARRELNAEPTYLVRWNSVIHDFNNYFKVEERGQFLATEEDAEDFEQALREAVALLRDGNMDKRNIRRSLG